MWSLLVRSEEKQPYHRAAHCCTKAPALANGAAASWASQLLLLELHPEGCLWALTEPGCTAAQFVRASSPWHMLAFQQKPTGKHDGKHCTVWPTEHHRPGLFRSHSRGNLLMIKKITSNPLFCSSYIMGSRKRSDPLNPAAVAWHPNPAPNIWFMVLNSAFAVA